MANMAGTWIGMTRGFGGMRLRREASPLGRYDMLSFAPVCPPEWRSYSFCITFRGRLIRVHADKNGASYELLRGEKMTILSYGEPVTLQ